MKISISQNISKLRRANGMTQEQLAEALGVSFAAVSKWERGVATPELDTIVEMADLFCVSVDALLGYEMRRNDLASVAQRLRAYSHTHARDDGAIQEAEKALQRFPNSFEIVYQSAMLFSVRGLDENNREYTKRALSLLQHACRLIDQNTHEDVDECSIHQHMAMEYVLLGENEKGIELLKQYNPCGLNNALIGMRLAANGSKTDEAIGYLSYGLLDFVSQHYYLTIGYLNVYTEKKRFAEAEALLAWALAFYSGLKPDGQTSHLEKNEAVLWAVRAWVQMELGQPEAARAYLHTARMLALHFDEAPNYDAASMRFVDIARSATAHDDFGQTAMEAVEKAIADQENEQLTQLWETVKHEKQH